MKQANISDKTNTIFENNEGILEVHLAGKQTTATVHAMLGQVHDYVDRRIKQGKKRLMLIDMSRLKVSDATRQARTESRKLLAGLPVDVIACVGSGVLVNMATYIIRLANPHVKVIYSQTLAKGRRQLLTINKPKVAHSEVALVASLAITIIGILGFVGWWISNPYFKSFIPSLRPINPTAALALIALGGAYFCYWRKMLRPLRALGLAGVAVGVAALLPLNIDTIFFHDKVIAAGGHVQLADSAAVCFILCGAMGILAWRPGRLVRSAQYCISSAIIAIALFNVYGQLYAHDYIYGLSGSFVMALNLAIAFLFAGVSFVLLVIYRKMGGVLTRVSRVGWLIVVSLIFVQLATYSAWNQSISRNKEDTSKAFQAQTTSVVNALQGRIQAYRDALHGFSGFFAASEYVSQGEFESYNHSLSLKETYPGLRSVAFISIVPDNQLAAFEKQHQLDTSLNPGGNPTFKIQPKTTYNPHFIATYVPDNPSGVGLGTDVSSIPGRYQLYSSAVASGRSYASGTVTFQKTALRPAAKGFFITFPVKNSKSVDYIGLVNANFDYATFFSKLFTASDINKHIEVSIKDDQGERIFHDNERTAEAAQTQTISVPIANRSWLVTVGADKIFGMSDFQARVPALILIVGQTFTALLTLIFILQARARKHAFELADIATADLQSERKAVIELNKKDEAILSGIGEGLVSINHSGIIGIVNAAATRQLGRSETDLVGRHYASALPIFDAQGKRVPEAKRPIYKVLAGHKPITEVIYYERSNGALFPARINVAPVVIEGRIVGAIEIFQDITKELELDKAKSEFVSLASHQLRTPLSAISWYTEMLLGGDAGKITKDQSEYLDEIYQGNRRMVELVDALLNVSRLELGKLRNDPLDTALTDIAVSLEKEMQGTIKTHAIDYNHDFEPHLPKVYADPKLLRIIVQNLLSNAVKYTPDGGKVRLVIRRATSQEVSKAQLAPGKYLFMSVTDTGYGIPEEQRGKIFQKMFRADNVRKLDVEGTGLGLYIVQESVKLFGGAIWFESKESIGTTFYVIIPIQTKPRG